MTWKYINREIAFNVILRRAKVRGQSLSKSEFNVLVAINSMRFVTTNRIMKFLQNMCCSTTGTRLKTVLGSLEAKQMINKNDHYHVTGTGLMYLTDLEKKMRKLKWWKLKKIRV